MYGKFHREGVLRTYLLIQSEIKIIPVNAGTSCPSYENFVYSRLEHLHLVFVRTQDDTNRFLAKWSVCR